MNELKAKINPITEYLSEVRSSAENDDAFIKASRKFWEQIKYNFDLKLAVSTTLQYNADLSTKIYAVPVTRLGIKDSLYYDLAFCVLSDKNIKTDGFLATERGTGNEMKTLMIIGDFHIKYIIGMNFVEGRHPVDINDPLAERIFIHEFMHYINKKRSGGATKATQLSDPKNYWNNPDEWNSYLLDAIHTYERERGVDCIKSVNFEVYLKDIMTLIPISESHHYLVNEKLLTSVVGRLYKYWYYKRYEEGKGKGNATSIDKRTVTLKPSLIASIKEWLTKLIKGGK